MAEDTTQRQVNRLRRWTSEELIALMKEHMPPGCEYDVSPGGLVSAFKDGYCIVGVSSSHRWTTRILKDAIQRYVRQCGL